MIKLAIFWIGSILGVFGGILAYNIYRPFIYFVFGAQLFSLLFSQVSINFLSAEYYRGTARGIEVHLAGLFTLILLAYVIQNRKRYRICWVPPMTIPFLLIFMMAFLSWVFTESSIFNPASMDPKAIALKEGFLEPNFNTGLYPFFEMSKMLWGYLIFWTTVNFIRDKEAINTLACTMGLMLIYATLASLYQRYILGAYRVTLLSDTNIFNCFIGMLGVLVMPFAFYTQNLKKSCYYWFATICALVVIILTVSRSSLFGFVVGMIFISIFGLLRFKNMRNQVAIAVAMVLCLGLFVKASHALFIRFGVSESIVDTGAGRESYEQAAVLMGNENFFGVGINNFSAYSGSEYGRRAGAEPGALAHNIWYLTYGEMGILGLLVFIWFWLCYFLLLFRCFRNEYRQKDDLIYTLLLGILASMFIVQFQDLFHFSYRFTSIYFLTNIIIGLTVRIFFLQKAIK